MRRWKSVWPGFLWAVVATSLGAAPAWTLGEKVPAKPGADFNLSNSETFYLEVVDDRFHAVFIDADRLAILPPVPQIILNGEGAVPRHKGFNLALETGGGVVFSHPRRFPEPHDFWFSVVVPREGEAEAEVLPRQRFRQ